MNGVIYCRVSSKEQVEGTSLESQEVACREYATRNGVNVLKVFVERGESAKFADRPQLLELLQFCGRRDNAVRLVMVWKVDRLARNVGDHFHITTTLKKQGILVASVTEPIDSNPEGKLLETILAGFAQFDNDLRAARTLQGMRRKIQEGIFPWKPPIGYKTINQRGSKKTRPDVPDEPRFGLLQRAWNEFASGTHTKAEILRLLTAWGLRTDQGVPMSHQSLDKMLCDPYYAGLIRDPWSGEEHVGQHIAMVSRDVFAQVQTVIKKRNRSVRHKSVHPELPLRAFARCPACGQRVTGSMSRGRSQYYPYYHCFRSDCNEPIYCSANGVHEEFREFLSMVTPSPTVFEKLGACLAATTQNRVNRESKVRERRHSEIQRLNRQHQQLIEMKMENLLTKEEFIRQKTSVSTRLYELQAAEPHSGLTLDQLNTLIEATRAPLMDLSSTWTKCPPVLKPRFQQIILPAGFVIGRIGTAQVSSLFSFFWHSERPDATVVAPTCEYSHQCISDLENLARVFELSRDTAVHQI